MATRERIKTGVPGLDSVLDGGLIGDSLYLFEPFKRTAPARSGERGLGLGLFIARAIVRAHGGEIAVRSAAAATVFEVTLPLAVPRLPGAPHAQRSFG